MRKFLLTLTISLVIGLGVFAALNSAFWGGIFPADNPTGDLPIARTATGTPDMLWVPSLDIAAPVLYSQRAEETEFQQLLQSGVVHYPGTALPGQRGNAYIFGHSSDFVFAPGNYKTVFARLPEIGIGEFIRITGSDGALYEYVVIETRIVANTDTSVLRDQDPARARLTLQTSYPVGTALKRFLAIAELVAE